MSTESTGKQASSPLDDLALLTRRDLKDALYAKIAVGVVSAVVGLFFVFKSATGPAGTAALIVSALCLLEAFATKYRMSRRT